jgi:tetratricopeptide (TPR) repeat protein
MPNTADIQGDNNRVFQDIKDSTINYYESTSAKLPKDLTLKIPKVHLSDVIGRENELDDLHKLLFDNQQVVLVNGLGGIGKTTLAQAYLSKYYDQYSHVAWISQSSDALMNAFVNDEGLKKNLNLNTQGKDLDMIFNEIMLGLKSITEKPNLLLIDNAETSLTAYVDVLPHQPNWHVLVTSRENIERFYLKELGFLTPEKALELFKTHCTRITDEEAINDLLKTIDYHTLTIEILAKTAQIQRNDVVTLKKAIENDLRANVFVNHKGEKIEKVRSYLSSIFDLSKLNENEIWLMKQFACLPTEFHSYDLLLDILLPTEKDDYKELFAETISELVSKGWLLLNPKTDSFKMHRVIVDITKQKLDIYNNDVILLIGSIALKLNIDDLKDNPIDKFQWASFGETLINLFESDESEEMLMLQNSMALILRAFGDLQRAELMLKKVVITYEKKFGVENPVLMASFQSNLGLVLYHLGKYSESKNYFEKALFSFEQNLGIEDPITLRCYSSLSVVLAELKDLKGAKILLEKTIITHQRISGVNHILIGHAYSNLGLVLYNLGDIERAKQLFEKAMEICEQNFGELHPVTSTIYSNLGTILRDFEDYDRAKELLEKAVKSDEKIFGENHPSTARANSNLAMLLVDLGNYEQAKKILEKSYIFYLNNLGSDHPTTEIIKSNLELVNSQLNNI